MGGCRRERKFPQSMRQHPLPLQTLESGLESNTSREGSCLWNIWGFSRLPSDRVFFAGCSILKVEVENSNNSVARYHPWVQQAWWGLEISGACPLPKSAGPLSATAICCHVGEQAAGVFPKEARFHLLIFIYLFLVALGLRRCVWAFSSCSEWGPLLTVEHGLLIVAASLAVEHGL